MDRIDFRSYACNTPEDLTPFIKYDRQRYLDFVAEFNRKVDALGGGEILSVFTYPPRQYKLFVKIATMHVFVSGMSSYRSCHDYHFEMTPDYTGIRKVIDRSSRRKIVEQPQPTDSNLFRKDE